MTEAAEVDAGLRQSREQTVLAHLEAENRQDVTATLATFKPGAARTELPGEVADGPDAVAATYGELFTALPDMHFDIKPGSLCHHGDRVMIETCLHQPSRANTRARCSRRVRPCQPPYSASNADEIPGAMANASASRSSAVAGQPARSSGIQPSHGSVDSWTATPRWLCWRLKPASHDLSSAESVK